MHSKNKNVPAHYMTLLHNTVVQDLNHKIEPDWFSVETYELFLRKHTINEYITAEALVSVLALLIERTGDHRITFEFGQKIDGSKSSILGVAVHSGKTFRDCADIFSKYVNTLVPFIHCDMEEQDTVFHFNWYLDLDEKLIPYTMEVLLASSKVGLQMSIPAHFFAYAKVNLNYLKPAYWELYEKYLPCQIEFGAVANSITSNTAILDMCNPNYDVVLNTICIDQLEKMSALDKGVLASVKQYIKSSLKTVPNIEEAARNLNISSRTLKRRLSLHGVTFSDLLHRERLQAGINYLQSSKLTIEDISHRLGYSHASSFIASFKRQYGITPAEWSHQMAKKSA